MSRIVRFDNGLRVITEQLPGFRSFSAGVWISAGTVYENGDENGISHYVEHMLFKGTETRSAKQIAMEMDSIGGVLNAFTTKEYTFFYADVPEDHAEEALDILSDIVLHSSFAEKEFRRERKVVLEEILMNEDLPEEVASDEANRVFFAEDRLAVPILGTGKSVRSFTRDALWNYYRRRYIPSNMAVSCAGSFSEERILAKIASTFGTVPAVDPDPVPCCGFPGGRRFSFAERDTEQMQICLQMPGFAMDSDEAIALSVLSNVIGGNMSSRLFQSIREKRGLAYVVDSDPVPSLSTGAFTVYAGTGEGQAEKVLELMLRELRAIRKNGITEQELAAGREQLRGGVILASESVHAHMHDNGRMVLLQNREYNEAEILARIECVTMERMNSIIPAVLDESSLCAAFVGPVSRQKKNLKKILDQ